jgi:putative transposase
VETVFLRTLYVLFFIEVGSRCIHTEEVTRNPDAAWVTQQARNLTMADELDGVCFLIRTATPSTRRPSMRFFEPKGLGC